MNRREFLKQAALAGLGAVALSGCRHSTRSASEPKVGRNRWQAGPVNGVDLVVAHRTVATEAVRAALQPFGGMAGFVRPGDRVLIKPNLAWARLPEQGACTSPEVLRAVIEACQEAGAGSVVVGDHTCDSARVAFELSGAREVCRQTGVPLVDYSPRSYYRPIRIAGGGGLQEDEVVADVLNCDVYINLPTLKHHATSQITLALKNQMGLVRDRQRYHAAKRGGEADNLHRNIVDLATALRPTLNILDGTRALKTNGPKGPGLVEDLGLVCASPNICAVDAYGARLLGFDPTEIPHIVLASQAGLGAFDLEAIALKEV